MKAKISNKGRGRPLTQLLLLVIYALIRMQSKSKLHFSFTFLGHSSNELLSQGPTSNPNPKTK